MKKIATGLISVPMSNVPGSENVEVRNLESEDAEAANHGGFNQLEVSSLDQSPDKEETELDDSILNLTYLNNSSQTEVIKSANFIFNITKVSKNMKQELIKLNAALNGLGYRNLIKMAANLANNDLVQGKYYLHESNQYAVQCLGSTDYTVNLPVVGRRGVYTTKVRLIWIVNINKNSIDVDNQVFNVGSSTITLGQTYGLENSDPVYGDSEKTWTEVSLDQLRDMRGNLLGGLRVGQVSPPVSGGTPARPGGAAQPAASSGPARDWDQYAASGGKDTEEIAKLWQSKPPQGYTKDYTSFQKWWADPKGGNRGTVEQVLGNLRATSPSAAGATGVDSGAVTNVMLLKYMTTPLDSQTAPQRYILIQELSNINGYNIKDNKNYVNDTLATAILEDPEWKSSFIKAYLSDSVINNTLSLRLATTSTDATPTATTPSPFTPQQGYSETLQVEGKSINVVSLGTWGGDQIFVDKDSLNTNSPALYIKDNKTDNLTRMGPRQLGRKRQYLGPTEASRAKRALVNSGVSDAKADAFLKYMKASRRVEKRDGPLSTRKGRERRQGAKVEALEGLRTSARQSRLDNLRKKGII